MRPEGAAFALGWLHNDKHLRLLFDWQRGLLEFSQQEQVLDADGQERKPADAYDEAKEGQTADNDVADCVIVEKISFAAPGVVRL